MTSLHPSKVRAARIRPSPWSSALQAPGAPRAREGGAREENTAENGCENPRKWREENIVVNYRNWPRTWPRTPGQIRRNSSWRSTTITARTSRDSAPAAPPPSACHSHPWPATPIHGLPLLSMANTDSLRTSAAGDVLIPTPSEDESCPHPRLAPPLSAPNPTRGSGESDTRAGCAGPPPSGRACIGPARLRGARSRGGLRLLAQ